MQQAIPYKAWTLPLTSPKPEVGGLVKGTVRDAITENAVIVVAPRGCCMSHVVKRLLISHGVNPSVFEFEELEEKDVVKEVERITAEEDSRKVQFPVVFISGKMYGGLDQVMASHINGELVPVLKQAGALWL